jgi:TonB family protein
MKETTLSRLYFESIAFPSTSTFWFALAVILHVALFVSPILTSNRPGQEIIFLQGDAGVELELLADDGQPPQPENAPPNPNPPSVVNESPVPDHEVIVQADFQEPERIAHPSKHPNVKRSAAQTASAAKAGTAVAQRAAQTFTTQPPYPPQARTLGIEGSVRLRVRVASDGSPRTVEILRSSGRSDFDNASLSTVRREWRFRPARSVDGRPVESTIVVAIQFVLNS